MRRLLIALVVTTSAVAQKDPVSRSWNQPVEPFRVFRNIYYVGASDVTSYLITTPEGHIVLDGGFEETAPMILANIEKLGFRPRDVKLLIGSHAHYDHAGGLLALKRATGARFLASAPEIPLYARGGLGDPQFGDLYPFPPIEADGIVNDRQRISLGGETVVANVTPGHTRGCTTWTMRTGGRDVVFFCSPTVPGPYKLVGNPLYPDAIADYQAQFERLESLPCEVFLASHGNFFELQEKIKSGRSDAFIDPDGCREFVAGARARFETVAAEQGK